jgi:hypothetical protein
MDTSLEQPAYISLLLRLHFSLISLILERYRSDTLTMVRCNGPCTGVIHLLSFAIYRSNNPLLNSKGGQLSNPSSTHLTPSGASSLSEINSDVDDLDYLDDLDDPDSNWHDHVGTSRMAAIYASTIFLAYSLFLWIRTSPS